MPLLTPPARGLALALLTSLLACSSEATLDDPDLNGAYVGFGGGYTWAIDLAQSGSALSGSGTLTTDEATYPLALDGAYTYPVVGFSLDAEGLDVFTFDGRVSNEGDLLTGTIESADLFEAEVAFQRQ